MLLANLTVCPTELVIHPSGRFVIHPSGRLSGLGLGAWDSDLESSELSSLRAGRSSPSPYSPLSRYSSYATYSPSSLPPTPSTTSTYRRNSTIDLPILRQTSSHDLPPSLRRSSTLERAGSVAPDPTGPNYSRYASTLEDTKDWGFSTLRRRNSRTPGSRFPNDDIRF